MNKIFSFSISLLGTSSIALASIPFGIGSAAAQEAKAGDAADSIPRGIDASANELLPTRETLKLKILFILHI